MALLQNNWEYFAMCIAGNGKRHYNNNKMTSISIATLSFVFFFFFEMEAQSTRETSDKNVK